MNDAMIEQLVQFTHPEKVYGYLPGVSDASLAALLGLDEAAYRAIKSRFDARAREAAQGLLDDPAFAARVDRVPFGAGETVLVVGDSFTDDLQSWLEILRHLFQLRRPRDEVRFVNLGVSGYTTAMALRYSVAALARRPDWILCSLGGNDATRIGPAPNKTWVSLEETARNLAALRRIAAVQSAARWAWITPPTVDEARVDAYPPFRQGLASWRNDDMAAIGDVLRAQPEPVVDVQAVFGRPPDPELQGPDGVHPSLAGQRAIAGAVVERLARLEPVAPATGGPLGDRR